MIRVLHFVSTPAIWSGVMSVIMNYYRHIDRSRVQFDFLCFIPCEHAQESYEKEIESLGGRVFFIQRPCATLEFLKNINAFFLEHSAKYTHFHNHEVYLSFFLRPFTNHYGIKVFIMHSHATKYSDKPLSALRNRFLCLPISLMRNGAKGHVERFACSKAAGEFLYGRRAMKAGKVFVLYNAIDINQYLFRPIRRTQKRLELGFADDNLVLGHIGRFVLQKNHSFLLDIFDMLLKSNPDTRLVCVGDGPLREDIERKADALHVKDKIRFLGPRDDIAELLCAMDVFILPSLFEGFPVSLVEACCNGLECIISTAISNEFSNEKIHALPLGRSPRNWAEKILSITNTDRTGNGLLPVFDIKYQTGRLQEFYLK